MAKCDNEEIPIQSDHGVLFVRHLGTAGLSMMRRRGVYRSTTNTCAQSTTEELNICGNIVPIEARQIRALCTALVKSPRVTK
jgi:hypothetical protein